MINEITFLEAMVKDLQYHIKVIEARIRKLYKEKNEKGGYEDE